MYKISNLLFLIFVFCFSCKNPSKPENEENTAIENKIKKPDTVETDFTIINTLQSTVQNGESIEYYDGKKIKFRGMMKDGNRDGLWKSWYEDGTPWSETTFKDGKKNGKTTTWYENGKKRYEGSYRDDAESGKWTFWNEQGVLTQAKDYK